MRLLNETANVVANYLAQHFISHRHIRFAANVITKFRFDHGERGLDIAALVVSAGRRRIRPRCSPICRPRMDSSWWDGGGAARLPEMSQRVVESA